MNPEELERLLNQYIESVNAGDMQRASASADSMLNTYIQQFGGGQQPQQPPEQRGAFDRLKDVAGAAARGVGGLVEKHGPKSVTDLSWIARLDDKLNPLRDPGPIGHFNAQMLSRIPAMASGLGNMVTPGDPFQGGVTQAVARSAENLPAPGGGRVGPPDSPADIVGSVAGAMGGEAMTFMGGARALQKGVQLIPKIGQYAAPAAGRGRQLAQDILFGAPLDVTMSQSSGGRESMAQAGVDLAEMTGSEEWRQRMEGLRDNPFSRAAFEVATGVVPTVGLHGLMAGIDGSSEVVRGGARMLESRRSKTSPTTPLPEHMPDELAAPREPAPVRTEVQQPQAQATLTSQATGASAPEQAVVSPTEMPQRPQRPHTPADPGSWVPTKLRLFPNVSPERLQSYTVEQLTDIAGRVKSKQGASPEDVEADLRTLRVLAERQSPRAQAQTDALARELEIEQGGTLPGANRVPERQKKPVQTRMVNEPQQPAAPTQQPAAPAPQQVQYQNLADVPTGQPAGPLRSFPNMTQEQLDKLSPAQIERAIAHVRDNKAIPKEQAKADRQVLRVALKRAKEIEAQFKAQQPQQPKTPRQAAPQQPAPQQPGIHYDNLADVDAPGQAPVQQPPRGVSPEEQFRRGYDDMGRPLGPLEPAPTQPQRPKRGKRGQQQAAAPQQPRPAQPQSLETFPEVSLERLAVSSDELISRAEQAILRAAQEGKIPMDAAVRDLTTLNNIRAGRQGGQAPPRQQAPAEAAPPAPQQARLPQGIEYDNLDDIPPLEDMGLSAGQQRAAEPSAAPEAPAAEPAAPERVPRTYQTAEDRVVPDQHPIEIAWGPYDTNRTYRFLAYDDEGNALYVTKNDGQPKHYVLRTKMGSVVNWTTSHRRTSRTNRGRIEPRRAPKGRWQFVPEGPSPHSGRRYIERMEQGEQQPTAAEQAETLPTMDEALGTPTGEAPQMRPSRIPSKLKGPVQAGELVSHPRLGEGTVMAVLGEQGGEKILSVKFGSRTYPIGETQVKRLHKRVEDANFEEVRPANEATPDKYVSPQQEARAKTEELRAAAGKGKKEKPKKKKPDAVGYKDGDKVYRNKLETVFTVRGTTRVKEQTFVRLERPDGSMSLAKPEELRPATPPKEGPSGQGTTAQMAPGTVGAVTGAALDEEDPGRGAALGAAAGMGLGLAGRRKVWELLTKNPELDLLPEEVGVLERIARLVDPKAKFQDEWDARAFFRPIMAEGRPEVRPTGKIATAARRVMGGQNAYPDATQVRVTHMGYGTTDGGDRGYKVEFLGPRGESLADPDYLGLTGDYVSAQEVARLVGDPDIIPQLEGIKARGPGASRQQLRFDIDPAHPRNAREQAQSLTMTAEPIAAWRSRRNPSHIVTSEKKPYSTHEEIARENFMEQEGIDSRWERGYVRPDGEFVPSNDFRRVINPEDATVQPASLLRLWKAGKTGSPAESLRNKLTPRRPRPGAADAQVVGQMATTGAGAAVGAGLDDEDPLRGALLGAAAGAVAPTVGLRMLRTLRNRSGTRAVREALSKFEDTEIQQFLDQLDPNKDKDVINILRGELAARMGGAADRRPFERQLDDMSQGERELMGYIDQQLNTFRPLRDATKDALDKIRPADDLPDYRVGNKMLSDMSTGELRMLMHELDDVDSPLYDAALRWHARKLEAETARPLPQSPDGEDPVQRFMDIVGQTTRDPMSLQVGALIRVMGDMSDADLTRLRGIIEEVPWRDSYLKERLHRLVDNAIAERVADANAEPGSIREDMKRRRDDVLPQSPEGIRRNIDDIQDARAREADRQKVLKAVRDLLSNLDEPSLTAEQFSYIADVWRRSSMGSTRLEINKMMRDAGIDEDTIKRIRDTAFEIDKMEREGGKQMFAAGRIEPKSPTRQFFRNFGRILDGELPLDEQARQYIKIRYMEASDTEKKYIHELITEAAQKARDAGDIVRAEELFDLHSAVMENRIRDWETIKEGPDPDSVYQDVVNLRPVADTESFLAGLDPSDKDGVDGWVILLRDKAQEAARRGKMDVARQYRQMADDIIQRFGIRDAWKDMNPKAGWDKDVADLANRYLRAEPGSPERDAIRDEVGELMQEASDAGDKVREDDLFELLETLDALDQADSGKGWMSIMDDVQDILNRADEEDLGFGGLRMDEETGWPEGTESWADRGPLDDAEQQRIQDAFDRGADEANAEALIRESGGDPLGNLSARQGVDRAVESWRAGDITIDDLEETVRSQFIMSDDDARNLIYDDIMEAAADASPADAKRLRRLADVLDLKRDQLGFIDKDLLRKAFGPAAESMIASILLAGAMNTEDERKKAGMLAVAGVFGGAVLHRGLSPAYRRMIGEPVWDKMVSLRHKTADQVWRYAPRVGNFFFTGHSLGDSWRNLVDSVNRQVAESQLVVKDLLDSINELPKLTDEVLSVYLDTPVDGAVLRGDALIDRLVNEHGFSQNDAARAARVLENINSVFEGLGQRMVSLGMLHDRQFRKWVGQYAPRLYEQLQGKGGYVDTRGSSAPLRIRGRERLKSRKAQVSDKLTRVESIKVRAATGILQEAQMAAQGEFFRAVAANNDWVDGAFRDASFILRDAKKELDGINNAITRRWAALKSNPKIKTKNDDGTLVRLMDTKAHLEDRIKKLEGQLKRAEQKIDRTKFRKLENRQDLGDLSGLWVRNDVQMEVDGIARQKPVHGTLIDMYSRALRLWKTGKTALNPATFMRNLYGANILGWLGDGPALWDDPEGFVMAFQALRTRGKTSQKKWNDLYKLAREQGLFDSTFARDQLTGVRDDYQATRNMAGVVDAAARETKSAKMGVLRRAGRKAVENYGMVDQGTRLRYFADAIERRGMTPEAAAREAKKWIPTYDHLSNFTKTTSLIIPFFAFTARSLPRILESAVKNPLRLISLGAISWGMNQVLFDEDMPQEALPPEMQGPVPGKPSGVVQNLGRFLMPTYVPIQQKDQNRRVYLDFTYMMPYGDIAEGRGREYGPLSRIPQQFNPASNPLASAWFGLDLNKDPFTSKEIVRRSDTPLEKLRKSADFVAADMLPGLTPEVPGLTSGGWGYQKLKKAGVLPHIDDETGRVSFDPQEDWYGEVTPRFNAIVDQLGLKQRIVVPEREMNRRMIDLQKVVVDSRNSLMSTLGNRGLSEQEREAARRRHQEVVERVRRQMQYMREEVAPRVPRSEQDRLRDLRQPLR